MRRWIWLPVLLLLMLPAPNAAAAPRPKLSVFRAGIIPGAGELTGLGTVRCFRQARLRFPQRGVLAQVLVKEGERVRQGQVLARLDDRVIKAQIEAKRVELMRARQRVKYLTGKLADQERLYHGRAITLQELKDIRQDLADARQEAALRRSELAVLKARLAEGELRAPFAGTVIERKAEPGEAVEPGEKPVLVVMDCSQVLAEVSFGEKLYPRVALDQPVLLKADAVFGRDFLGRVHAKSPGVNPKDRTFKVKVLLPNPQGLLRPGMFVRATLLSGGPGRALWLPRRALQESSGRRGVVHVLHQGRIQRRSLRLGRGKGGMVEVLEGLKPGELVVLPQAAPVAAGEKAGSRRP